MGEFLSLIGATVFAAICALSTLTTLRIAMDAMDSAEQANVKADYIAGLLFDEEEMK